MEEKKVCKVCGKELSIESFQKTKNGGRQGVCRDCMKAKQRNGWLNSKRSLYKKMNNYADPMFDGKTPREVQDILARAAKWLNNYGGFTCEVSLRYAKTINLDIK